MLFDDLAAHRKADAGAAFAAVVRAALGGVEAVEDVGQLVGRDTGAGVADREVDGVGVGATSKSDETVIDVLTSSSFCWTAFSCID